MKTVRIERFGYTPNGTFGRLVVHDGDETVFSCFTVERPWLGNRPNLSCVPVGTYQATLGVYHRGGYPAYELQDVPGRTLITLHIANTMDELRGCIGVGETLGWVRPISRRELSHRWGVKASRRAYNRLMAILEKDAEISVVIENQEAQGVL